MAATCHRVHDVGRCLCILKCDIGLLHSLVLFLRLLLPTYNRVSEWACQKRSRTNSPGRQPDCLYDSHGVRLPLNSLPFLLFPLLPLPSPASWHPNRRVPWPMMLVIAGPFLPRMVSSRFALLGRVEKLLQLLLLILAHFL